MTSVNIDEAGADLARLVAVAAAGGTVVIVQAGHPVAKLTAIGSATGPRRLGFLAGQATVPEDFDHMAAGEIAELFDGRR